MKTLPIKRPLKKSLYLLIFVLLGFTLSCSAIRKWNSNREAPVHQLVVLHTNDTHGHPVKFFNYPIPNVGGLPARATLVKQIRKENKNVLVLDAGDLNTGRAESNLFKAKPDIEGYNYIGYDAMALGNHEFDNPVNVLKWQMRLACFPFLSANVKTRNGEYLAQPYIIKKFDGFRVAIFGLTTKETEITGDPNHIKDLVFEEEIEVARKLVPELEKEADVVIALVHMGIYPSYRRGSKRLASEVSGIDLIVDGHTHTKLDSPILVKSLGSDHKTLIVQAWKWGLVIGKVDLLIRKKKVMDFRFQAIPINLKTVEKKSDGTGVYHFIGEEIEEDKELIKLLQPYLNEVDSVLSEVIGYAEETFLHDNVLIRETALGDIIADSMLWYTKEMDVDFAIQNGGGIRTALPEGKITRKLIYEILPFDDSVIVLNLKGSDVRSLFDYIATISGGSGAFPQVSKGLSFTINHAAGKCESILINGNPIDSNRIYKVATNSFLACGGDGYRMFLNAVDKYDSSVFQRDVLIDYIKHLGGRIRPKVRGSIKITNQERYSSLTGEKTSTTTESSKISPLCFTPPGIDQLAPASASNFSSPMVIISRPETTYPVCSWG
ncbi:MAG: 5'-nucleotidase C-terminal domain-containing protein [Deltaproteobacteria bacterium]|nr:5'-nucleotidase C-terminal domain-containing protein [Deltaproteobacteria bacterium]